MTIAFPCENCGHRFEVDASLAGKKCKCKTCGHIFLIPTPRSSASASPKPPTAPASASPRPAKPAGTPSRPAATVKPARPAKEKEPDPYYTGDDPYGFDDEPAASPSRRAVKPEDDDEFADLPPRAKPVTLTKVKKKKRSDGSVFDAAPWWVAKIGLGLALVSSVVCLFSLNVGLGLVAFFYFSTSLILYLMGSIGLLVIPFMESVACGLMYLFIPFYWLYYLSTRWQETKRWFLTTVAGTVLLFPGLIAAIGLPAIQAGRNAAQVVILRNEITALPPGSPQRAEKQAELNQLLARLQSQRNAARPQPTVPPQDPMLAEEPAPEPTPNDRNSVPAPRVRRTPSPRNLVRTDPAPDNTSAPAPALPAGVGPNPVVVRTNRVADRDTRDLFSQKLIELSNSLNGVHHRTITVNGRMTCTVWPIDDVQAFVDGINFAKVTRVNDRTIDVTLTPLPPSEQTAADADFVNQVLIDLKSPISNRRKDALRRLREALPDESRRGEVAHAIEPLLRDPDSWTRADACKAMGIWGGPDNTPALLAILKDPQFNVVWEALDALAALHDPAAAEAVAARLPENRDRGKAVAALKAMGPEAQDAVVPYLNHADVFVRMEACKILAEIGTTDPTRHAIIALYRRVNGHGLDAMAADEAIKRIGMPKSAAPGKKKSIVPK